MTNAEKFYREFFVVGKDYKFGEENKITIDAIQQYSDQEVSTEREKAKQAIEHCADLLKMQTEQLSASQQRVKEQDKELDLIHGCLTDLYNLNIK